MSSGRLCLRVLGARQHQVHCRRAQPPQVQTTPRHSHTFVLHGYDAFFRSGSGCMIWVDLWIWVYDGFGCIILRHMCVLKYAAAHHFRSLPFLSRARCRCSDESYCSLPATPDGLNCPLTVCPMLRCAVLCCFSCCHCSLLRLSPRPPPPTNSVGMLATPPVWCNNPNSRPRTPVTLPPWTLMFPQPSCSCLQQQPVAVTVTPTGVVTTAPSALSTSCVCGQQRRPTCTCC